MECLRRYPGRFASVVVIDVASPDAEPVEPAVRHDVFKLARFPNLSIKIHGLGEIARRAASVSPTFPFQLPVPPLLDLAYETFGPSRMMWGSDYPPVSARPSSGACWIT
jgi:L-fuconolactonase